MISSFSSLDDERLARASPLIEMAEAKELTDSSEATCNMVPMNIMMLHFDTFFVKVYNFAMLSIEIRVGFAIYAQRDEIFPII